MATTRKSSNSKSSSSRSSSSSKSSSKPSQSKAGSSKASSASKSKTSGAKSKASSSKSASGKPSAKKATTSRSTTKAKPTTSKAASSRKSSKSTSSTAKSRGAATSSAKSTKSRSKATSSKARSKPTGKGIIASAIDAVTQMFGSDTRDAITLLKDDHRKVESLFEKVKANEDGNNVATFKKIKEELDMHAHIEETIFYPHLMDKGDKELKKIVREGIEEHTQVKDLLAELAEMSDSPTFKAKLKVLMENVEHHVEEEEDEMFPMVEDQIPEETLLRLGSLMQGEKMKIGKMKPASKPRAKASAAASK